jgi:hypothetical protein
MGTSETRVTNQTEAGHITRSKAGGTDIHEGKS